METVNFEGQNISEAPKAPRNRKLIWGGIILAVLILAVIGWQYWQYINSPYYQQMKAVKILEKMAKESDKWGGKTPEETVRLFTEAVKKSDFDLASKYSISSLETEIKDTLNGYKNSEYWDDYLIWLGNLKKNTNPDQDFGSNSVIYESFDEKGRRVIFISLFRSESGTWKINEF